MISWICSKDVKKIVKVVWISKNKNPLHENGEDFYFYLRNYFLLGLSGMIRISVGFLGSI